MLLRDEQDILTQVSPDSNFGAWLQSFWFPIAISDLWEYERGQMQLVEPMTFKERVV